MSHIIVKEHKIIENAYTTNRPYINLHTQQDLH